VAGVVVVYPFIGFKDSLYGLVGVQGYYIYKFEHQPELEKTLIIFGWTALMLIIAIVPFLAHTTELFNLPLAAGLTVAAISARLGSRRNVRNR
jgi:hypothetical protein